MSYGKDPLLLCHAMAVFHVPRECCFDPGIGQCRRPGLFIPIICPRIRILAVSCPLEISAKASHIVAVAMKFLNLIFLLAAFTVSAQTNSGPWCCRYPLRVMGPAAGVNLKPLFQWWIQNGGQNEEKAAAASDSTTEPGYIAPTRPLSAWKRITGIKTSDLQGVWVVEATVYTSPTSRTNTWILLKNPPAVEEQRYYYLQSLIAEDAQQIAADSRSDQNDLRAEQREQAQSKSADNSYSKGVRNYGTDYGQMEAQHRNAAAAALADKKQYEQGRAEAQREFDALPGEHGHYKLDIFALELGRNSKGQLIYDAGQIYVPAP
jgi:hypothetical protein